MLKYIIGTMRSLAHNIYSVKDQSSSRRPTLQALKLSLTTLLPLINMMGEILAVLGIFAMGYFFLWLTP